jgi:drug/metabolite transporter (DMT)-like permease
MGMTIATGTGAKPERKGNALHFAALVGGNVALAVGSWPVRLADTGPVAAGFWRLILAVPLLLLLARANRQPLVEFSRQTWLIMVGAGVFFALDIASWHVGIGMTRLGNATLFGNSGSLILMAWGVLALRRSWDLTSGKAGPLALFFVLLVIAAAVIFGIVMLVTGVVLALLAGPETAKLVAALVSSALVAGVTVLFVGVVAAVHRQLAGPTAATTASTFD